VPGVKAAAFNRKPKILKPAPIAHSVEFLRRGQNTNLKTTSEIAAHLLDGIDYLNEHPKPYRWNKRI